MRAVAMLAICWDHWCPAAWPRLFPYEVFLFFFLVMTGYLITSSLLRERDRCEARGVPWRLRAMRAYQVRRGLRILAPYYAALAVAFALGASDLWRAPWWYLLHVSNLHMATLPSWPPATNHFWSLSIQQQFYLVWPLIVWFAPKRSLGWWFLLVTAAGPVTRWFEDALATSWERPSLLTPAVLDYFGVGALFALALHRGMSLASPGLRALSWAALAGYIAMYGSHVLGWPTFGLRFLQQTLLSIAICGFIAAVSTGFGGWFGRLLESRPLQEIGRLSYGVYLFHNLAPLLAGKVCWFLWNPSIPLGVQVVLRTPVFALITWGIALASWRWIERPLQDVRTRVARG
jgi:peptidoglycan/LPS O-acetylase OafA/YrhL